jgi:glycosyltransferase involved in cell wall biosynthesis
MRVGIDAHCLGQKKTGNETYTYTLIKYLSGMQRNGVEYTVYLGGELADQDGLFSNGSFRSKQIWPLNPFIRIPIGFAIQSRVEQLDVFHAQYLLPYGLKCRTVLTVHDVLYERYPQYFTKMDTYRHKIEVPRSCRRADHIITVSESSKRDLVDFYGLDPDQITVTYPGPDSSYRPIEKCEAKKRLTDKYGIEGDFILYVGAIQPRKNIPRLLSAFAHLKRARNLPHKLLLVGPKAWLSSEAFRALENNESRKDIRVTGYVPQEDLPYFYNSADLFVYASMCEGFGLPVVEAMACGTPTITSRGSSLEEIAGGAAVLVDPSSSEDIAHAIEEGLQDSALQAQLRESGLSRSRMFSCQKMAVQTKAIYEHLVG